MIVVSVQLPDTWDHTEEEFESPAWAKYFLQELSTAGGGRDRGDQRERLPRRAKGHIGEMFGARGSQREGNYRSGA